MSRLIDYFLRAKLDCFPRAKFWDYVTVFHVLRIDVTWLFSLCSTFRLRGRLPSATLCVCLTVLHISWGFPHVTLSGWASFFHIRSSMTVLHVLHVKIAWLFSTYNMLKFDCFPRATSWGCVNVFHVLHFLRLSDSFPTIRCWDCVTALQVLHAEDMGLFSTC
jgi:hypothetical protein